MNSERDPIVAIATPAGRGGIGIVRASGTDLTPIIQAVLGRSSAKLRPRRALHARFLDADGRALDEGIALLFTAPHSYTGEDVLELQAHGGPVVLRLLVARCLEAGRGIGLRIAEPGEFSRRAFLNGRLDLAQAEAVADLIDASSEAAVRSAVRSLEGDFSRAVRSLAETLIELRALVEATLDFPEEEIDFLERADAGGRLARVRTELDRVIRQSAQGAVLREGLDVVLVGRPNVGKSSLLNALAREEVAIVTPVAGTTRDRVIQRIDIDGIPVNVIDTAGLRDAADEVERLGIDRTLAAVERADAIVHVVDVTHPGADDDVLGRVGARSGRGVPIVTVFNKIDLTGEAARSEVNSVHLSARTLAGVDLLRDHIRHLAGWDQDTSGESVFLARERHLQALEGARSHLEIAAAHAAARDNSLELFAEELRLAANDLEAITGAHTADDLLGVIFSRFCIGK
jgi:tRNA modification GTPase